MSAVGERSPLATLAPANKRPAEVRERFRDGLYGAREDCGVCARATAKKLGRMGSSLAPQSTFPRASVESHASLTTAQPPHPPVSSLRANPTRSPPEQLYSLLALSRPEGAPAEERWQAADLCTPVARPLHARYTPVTPPLHPRYTPVA